jgi:hypothetical protein
MGGKKYTLENIALKGNELFNKKYSYISLEFINNYSYIIYKCPKHGIIKQRVANHLKGCGCKYCGIEKRAAERKTPFEEFVQKANKIHNNKYVYLELLTKNKRTYIKYICKEHGEQCQCMSNHLKGCGCEKCGGTKKLTEEELKDRLKTKFGDKISYIGNYKGMDNVNTKFKCNVCGNEFKNSFANVMGMINGCHHCSESLGAKKITCFFNSLNIKFIPEKWFKTCKDQNPLPFDFYIPSYNILIEYNGKQHYKPVRWSNSLTIEQAKQNLKKQRHHDWIKRSFCKKHNIKLITIPYWEYDNIEKILTEELNGKD